MSVYKNLNLPIQIITLFIELIFRDVLKRNHLICRFRYIGLDTVSNYFLPISILSRHETPNNCNDPSTGICFFKMLYLYFSYLQE